MYRIYQHDSILTILTREVITVDPGGLTPFPDTMVCPPFIFWPLSTTPFAVAAVPVGGLTRSDRELRPSELSHSITVAGVTQVSALYTVTNHHQARTDENPQSFAQNSERKGWTSVARHALCF